MEQAPPGVQEDARYLRERTSYATEGLRHTLTPPLGTIALELNSNARTVHKARESLRDFYPGILVPYRFAGIPPDFFGDETPHHFTSQEELDAHTAAYWQKDDQGAELYRTEPHWRGRMRRVVGEGMARVLLKDAAPVDLRGWDDYRSLKMDAYLSLKPLALNTFYTALVWPQAEADGYLDRFRAQNEAALITNTSLLLTGANAASLFRVPIMMNDVGFTRRFMNACITATTLASNNMRALIGFEKLLEDDNNRKLIHKHVQRANPQGGAPDIHYDATNLRHMSIEAVQSVASAYALMAKEQPEGYPYDGVSLIKDLAEQNMIDKFARLIPFGFIGPASLFGRYIPNLLYATKDEKYDYRLRFTPEAKTMLQEYSNHMATHFAVQWRAYDLQSLSDPNLYPPVQTGRRCPFTSKIRDTADPHTLMPSAIESYSSTIATIFQILNSPVRLKRFYPYV